MHNECSGPREQRAQNECSGPRCPNHCCPAVPEGFGNGLQWGLAFTVLGRTAAPAALAAPRRACGPRCIVPLATAPLAPHSHVATAWKAQGQRCLALCHGRGEKHVHRKPTNGKPADCARGGSTYGALRTDPSSPRVLPAFPLCPSSAPIRPFGTLLLTSVTCARCA